MLSAKSYRTNRTAPQVFNFRLVLLTTLGVLFLCWKLYEIALLTDNMKGFWYSAFNVVLVGIALVYTIRR
jgi:hypothetical protein